MMKYLNKRIVSILMSGITVVSAATYTACSKKPRVTETTQTTEMDDIDNTFNSEEQMVDSTIERIKGLGVNVSEEIIAKDSALLMLLSELAREDENGKISADVMSHFKNIINEQNMVDNYDALLNKVENAMLDGNFISLASVLPDNMQNEKSILSSIENIAQNALNNKNDKNAVLDAFDKMYTLFVEEKEINGFEVRDLPYSLRSAASSYAREVNHLARYYANEQKRSDLDKRTDDQNAKSYIINILGKISNQMEEQSLDKDLVERFNLMYTEFNNKIMPFVRTSQESQKNLVNFINLEYLTSEEVSTKDRKELVGEYDEKTVRSTFDLIDAITKYNSDAYLKDKENAKILGLEKILINGKEQDVLVLKFVQFNSFMLLNSVNENTTYEELMINPYYDNLTKYITKIEDNGSKGFVHKYKDSNGKEIEEMIEYQNISDGVHFVCDEIARYTLGKVKGKKNITENETFNTYYDQATRNVVNSIQYLQNTIYGECEKVDANEYVK